MRFVGKIIMLTFNDTEEKTIEKAIAVLAASPGRVFTKAQIFESAMPHSASGNRGINVTI